MSSNRGNHGRRDIGDGLEELDALVLEELMALGDKDNGRQPRHRSVQAKTHRARSVSRGEVIEPAAWGRAHRHDVDEPDEDPDNCCALDEGLFEAAVLRGTDDDSGMADDNGELRLDFDDTPAAAEDDVFTLEERHFIERAVKWLDPRPNKDLIVSRIWALLTDADPGEFHDAHGPQMAPADTAVPVADGPLDDPLDEPRGQGVRRGLTRLRPREPALQPLPLRPAQADPETDSDLDPGQNARHGSEATDSNSHDPEAGPDGGPNPDKPAERPPAVDPDQPEPTP